MTVKVKVYGNDTNSEEYIYAQKLKKILEQTIPNYVYGDMNILTNVTLFGQEIKDIDIILIGNMMGYEKNLIWKNNNNESINKCVDIKNFVTTIELKTHTISGIKRSGNDFLVKYNSSYHSVTEQSNKQKYSLKNHFENLLSSSPYITNMIWFGEVSKNELNTLLTIEGNKILSNVLPSIFDFDDFIQLVLYQKRPRYNRLINTFELSCANDFIDLNSMTRVINAMTGIKETCGELTRRKVEQLTNNFGNECMIQDFGDKMGVYRGNAGAGKTVVLLQTALKLVDDLDARVLVLTFNRILVSDLRRILSFMNLPDLFDESCLSIETMHSFFFKIINKLSYNGQLTSSEFNDYYDKYLNEFLMLLDDDDFKNDFLSIVDETAELRWDYVLIDEAQDWSKNEQQLITKLYNENNIIIADGGHQFVRNIEHGGWSRVKNKKNVKMKYCLRQKNNLIKFNNIFSKRIYNYANEILFPGKFLGGKIIIVENNDKLKKIIKTERESLINEGNVDYDIMILSTNKNVVKKDNEKYFRLVNLFDSIGLQLWDGINANIRKNSPLYNNKARVLMYESARGLEGWLVCCLDFDAYVHEKMDRYSFTTQVNQLMLENEEDKKKKFILNWALIPLTRAIDTLIITLDNPDSDISRLLRDIYENNKDYISWI